GQGATDKVTSDVAKLGVNMLTVVPGAERRGGASSAATPLTMEDARAIKREIAGISTVAPSSGRGMLVVFANKNWSTTVTGATSESAIAKAKDQLASLMRERRKIPPGAPDDFSVRDMKEIADTLSSVTGALTTLLGAVAAVSLLVGGIGIMNIMLVSVTERTR